LFRISNLGFRISERRAAARRDVVPIEEWANEFMYIAKSKDYGPEAKRKRVLKARLLPIAKRKSFYYDVR